MSAPRALTAGGGWGTRAALLAMACFAGGWLAQQLVIAPSYALACWPPAGIGLAALIAGGLRLWPGIWFGVFALGLTAASGDALWLAAVDATATSLQAVLAMVWLRRLGMLPVDLLDEWRTLQLLFIGGPAGGLPAAAVATGARLLVGAAGSEDAWLEFGTLWVAHALGAMLLAPPLLVWGGRDGGGVRQRALYTLTVAGLAGLAVLWFVLSSQREQALIRSRLDEQADRFMHRLNEQLHSAELLVAATAAFLGARDLPERREFEGFGLSLMRDHDYLLSLQWSEWVPAHRRDAFVAEVRAEGYPDFAIRELRPDGSLVPAGDEPQPRVVIRYLVPMAGNEAAFGFDIRSNPRIRQALDWSIASGERVASPPIHLVQETGDARGVVLYQPVYAPHVRDIEQPVSGFAAAVMRVPELLQGALQSVRGTPLRVELSDVTEPSAPERVLEQDPQPDRAPVALRSERSIRFGGRIWRLGFSMTRADLLARRSLQSWWLLVAGLLVSTHLGQLFLLLAGRNARVQKLVAQRTRDLTEANRALRERESSMERLLDELQESERKLRANSERLAESNRELEQFAHLASHDLKAPLRSVSSFAQLLERRLGDRLDEQSKEYLGFIRRGIRSMHELTDDLLSLSRINRDVLEREDVPLAKPLAEAVEQLRADIESSGCVIRVGELPIVSIDPALMRQVFQNLIANSIKFQPAGNRPEVSVACRGERDGWVVELRDNGIGIEPDQLERVFRVFARLHTEEAYPGTGVGLALVNKIIQLHGGRVWARVPEDGPGVVIGFWLPGSAG